jgi:hypothetical protein
VATPKVWSERNDPNAPGGAWRDCTYSSGLMMLVAGGWTKFPLGAYTVVEREALERSDNQPDETGASQDDLKLAIKNRYGISVGRPPWGIAEGVKHTELALSLQGSNKNLPYTHTLRRWDRSFTGGHEVCIVPLGNGKCLWLDPEAPMGYAGDVVDNATVIKWATGYGQMLYCLLDRFAPKPVPSPVVTPLPVTPPVIVEPPAPVTPPVATYTQAQMDTVMAELEAAHLALDAALAKIAAAQKDLA